MARVGDRDDAVANGELALKRLRVGIVLQAEQPAEVEACLVDVIVVVLDEAGTLAHHTLDQCVQSGGVAVVVGDGEQASALVVPGQGVGIVAGPRIVHGRGQRGEGLLGQEALVVAPGIGVGVVMDGDLLAGLAVVEPAGPGVDPKADEHGVMGEVHGVGLLNEMGSAGFGGGPLDEGLGMLERGLAADAGADEELADLAPEPCGVGDDGAEIDVVGHPVERAAERDQRTGVAGDHGALGIVDDGAGMGQVVPDLQEGRGAVG